MAQIYCILLGMCFATMSSQIRVSGNITDRAGLPVTNVNVFLKQGTSGGVVVFTSTDDDGNYALELQKPGIYTLQVTGFNYDSVSESLEIAGPAAIVKNLRLDPKHFDLDEVIIVPEAAISNKRDTIVFDAKAFLTGNENVVQDLLKKIPGLTVSDDGAVKVGNKEVEKIMVEGDDFFEKGYRLLTQNMPSQPIDKIELYQNYSSNDKLKGIEDSDKVALNLKIKDDVRRQWFGNADLGYGLMSENRYDATTNLMNFGRKSKFYLLSNFNNVGIDPIGELGQLIHPPGSDQAGELGEGLLAQPALSMNAFKPALSARRTDINNAELVSLNHIFSHGKTFKIKTLAFLNTDEQQVFNKSVETFSGPLQFQNTETSGFRPSFRNFFGKVNLNYNWSAQQQLEYTGKIHFRHNQHFKNVEFNGDNAVESLSEDKRLSDHKLTFTQKLGSQSVVLVNARHTLDRYPQRYAMDQSLYEGLFERTASGVFQNAINEIQFAGLDVHMLTKSGSGNLFEAKIGDQIRKDNLQTQFGLLQPYFSPSAYYNGLRYRSNNAYVQLKYLLAVHKKIRLGSGVEIQYLSNKISEPFATRQQQQLLINPRLRAEYQISSNNRIVVSYGFSRKNASVLEVSSGYINTGLRSFSRGIADFAQLASSEVSVYHNYSNWSKRFFISNQADYVTNHDYFSIKSLLTQNYSLSDRILVKNRKSIRISSSIDRYIKAMRCNFKLALFGQQAVYQNSINNSGLRNITNSEFNARLELRSGFKGLFNYHAGFQGIYNQNKAEVSRFSSDNIVFTDLYFVLNKHFDVQLKSERFYFSNLTGKKAYYFMDLEARYDISPGKILFSLCGNNLLNTKSFRTFDITDVSTVASEYILQARYLLLKLKINF